MWQIFQLYGIFKKDLKYFIQVIDVVLFDMFGVCGDDNCGVVCLLYFGLLYVLMFELVRMFSQFFLLQSCVYWEIWLGEQVLVGSFGNEELFYGFIYLFCKFKIVFVLLLVNDVDIYVNDFGFIGIVEGSELVGFNVSVGGGMGCIDNELVIYFCLVDVIGFCWFVEVFEVVRQVVVIQCDYGDWVDCKYVCFKYILDD